MRHGQAAHRLSVRQETLVGGASRRWRVKPLGHIWCGCKARGLLERQELVHQKFTHLLNLALARARGAARHFPWLQRVVQGKVSIASPVETADKALLTLTGLRLS